MTIHHAFMITSAVNTKFGVYDNDTRLKQTQETIASIRRYIPDARIVLVESGAIPLTQQQEHVLRDDVDELISFSDDEDVQAIYLSDNWDIVKNSTEVMCFRRALEHCLDNSIFKGVGRVHKMSGRYRLNNNFDPAQYVLYPNSIIVTQKRASHFPPGVTGVDFQYMSRLWSWPKSMTREIIEMYDTGLDYMASRLSTGGYCDIEHMLYKLLPAQHVIELSKIGLEGNIGPNGAAVDD